jgi:hypothetical protein
MANQYLWFVVRSIVYSAKIDFLDRSRDLLSTDHRGIEQPIMDH